MTPPDLPIAVRGYPLTSKPKPKKGSRKRKKPVPRPTRFLIFDTETTTDRSQKLLFGVYQFCVLSDDRRALMCRASSTAGVKHRSAASAQPPEHGTRRRCGPGAERVAAVLNRAPSLSRRGPG